VGRVTWVAIDLRNPLGADMNQSTTSPFPEAVPGVVDLESFDGWTPAADQVLTCYTISLELSSS
jgi:hypothetical protein